MTRTMSSVSEESERRFKRKSELLKELDELEALMEARHQDELRTLEARLRDEIRPLEARHQIAGLTTLVARL